MTMDTDNPVVTLPPDKPEAEQAYCLICAKTFRLPDLFVAQESSLFPPQDPAYLSNDLYVYFLMKHCFEVSSRKLEKYLKSCPRPEKWIRVCSSCHFSYVEECARLYVKLVEIQRKFREAKRKLVETVKGKEEEPLEKADKWVFDIGRETVRFVKRHSYNRNLLNSNGNHPYFEAGLEEEEDITNKRTKAATPSPPPSAEPAKRKRGRPPRKSVHSELTDVHKKVSSHFNNPESLLKNTEPSSVPEPEIPVKRKRGRPKKIAQTTVPLTTTDFPSSAVIKEEPLDISDLVLHAPDFDDFDEPSPPSPPDRNDPDFDPFTEANASPAPQIQDTQVEEGNELVRVSENDNNEDGYASSSGESYEPDPTLRRVKKSVCFQDGPDIRCRKCLKIFRTEHLARRHYFNIHKHEGKYPCTHCGRAFGANHRYKRHLNSVHGIVEKSNFNCTFPNCGQGFVEKSMLGRHELLHYPPTLKCNICDNLFRLKQNLLKHLNTHKGKGETKSGVCQWSVVKSPEVNNETAQLPEEESGSLSDLERDEEVAKETEQTSSGPRTCRTCGKKCEDIKSLKRHYHKAHSRQGAFTCYLCPKTFPFKYRFFRHLRQVHNVEDHRIHPCPAEGCNKKFSDQQQLDNHVKVHEPPTLSCPKCKKMFRFQKHLTVHLRRHDAQGTKNLPCPYCTAMYSFPGDLKQHIRIKHDDLPPEEMARHMKKKYVRVTCTICSKEFTENYKLKRHMSMVHKSKEHSKYFCEFEACKGKGFPEKSLYDKHMEKHIVPQHACHYCGKMYKKKENLKIHILRHENKYEQKFFCDQCPCRYSQKIFLTQHIRLKHPTSIGLPDHKLTCEECGVERDNKRALECHMRRVHRKKPMCCEICGKMIMSTHMKHHIEAMHSDHRETKPHKCEICGKGFSRREYVRGHKKIHLPNHVPRRQRKRVKKEEGEESRDADEVIETGEPVPGTSIGSIEMPHFMNVQK